MSKDTDSDADIGCLEDESGTLGLLVTTVEGKECTSVLFDERKRRDVPQLEVLAALQSELCLGLADGALQTEHDLLGGLGLLSEDRLGLTTVTALLSVVTTLTLGVKGSLIHRKGSISNPLRGVRFCCARRLSGRRRECGAAHLASLVLGDSVLSVLLALLGLAVRPAGFRDVDLGSPPSVTELKSHGSNCAYSKANPYIE